MRINKIYDKKNINKHFKRQQKLEKKSILGEKISLTLSDIKEFFMLEKKNIFTKYSKKIIINAVFLLLLFFTQKIILSINIPFLTDKINNLKNNLNFSPGNYFNYLLSCLGVGGFLTALFFSNLSGVFSSRYSNLTTKVSSSILKEYMNKKYFESIVNYLTLLIIEILCYTVNIKLNFLITIVTFFLTIRIIIIFITLSKRIFGFNNKNYITNSMCQEIMYYYNKLEKAIKHKKKKSVILSYRQIIESKINILEELHDSFIRENDIAELEEFDNFIIELLSIYCDKKNELSFDNLWYSDNIIKPKNWFEAEFYEIKIGLETGTSLTPTYEKNKCFFEDVMTNMIIKSVNFYLKQNLKNELLKMLNCYQFYFKKIKENGDFSYWYNFNKNLIDIIIANDILFKEDDDKVTAIVDLIGLLFEDYILEYTKYINQLYSKTKIYTKNINQFIKGVGSNNCILNSVRTNDLMKKMKFEKKYEKKYITSDYYIKEYVFWELNEYIVKYIESFSMIIADLKNISEILYKRNDIISACIILSRIIEVSKKIDYSMRELSLILKEINQFNVNFKYTKIDLDKERKNKESMYILSLLLYSDLIVALDKKGYDYRDKNIDFFGECFYNLCEETFNAIINENFENFEKLYKKFTAVTIICDRVIHRIIDDNYVDNYKISKYKIPVLHFMNISGYVIYYSHLTKKPVWEELVNLNFQVLLNITTDKKVFLKKLIAAAFVDYNQFNIDVLKSDFKFKFQQFIKDSNYLENKKNDSIYLENANNNDNLLKKFIISDYGVGFEFYEIFIYYYVNPEVDDSEKYKVHFGNE